MSYSDEEIPQITKLALKLGVDIIKGNSFQKKWQFYLCIPLDRRWCTITQSFQKTKKELWVQVVGPGTVYPKADITPKWSFLYSYLTLSLIIFS